MNDPITEFVEAELESRRIPGAALAVLRPGASTWAQGFGVANVETGEPMTAQTPFSIQSITKTFIATAIMQLEERGLLSIDDLASKHLPGVVQNEWEAESPVLVRQLLTHTSGLPEDTGRLPGGGPLPLEDFVRAVANTERPPGGGIVYANWGYDVLGLLIETLTGETWYGYIEKHICEPLGMRSTGVRPPENAAYGSYLSAVDGEWHKLGRARWPVEPSDPAGGLVSTVGDLALFAAAHLFGGSAVLNTESTARMHTVAAGRQADGMALGFRATHSNGRALVCHGGDGSGFTNFLGLYPDEGVGVVLTLNRAGVQAARSVIANTVLRDLAGAETPHLDISTVLDEGLYSSSFWDIEVAVETNKREVTARPLAGLVISDGPQPSILASIGGDALIAEGGMFHGFEVTVEQDGSFRGGLYPYRFTRTGDIPPPEPAVDESADLAGAWSGTITTPMGFMTVSLAVVGDREAEMSTPFAAGVRLDDCDARRGRVSGRFALTVPGVGETTMFPRLEARGGRLRGLVYARGWFGELPMQAELERV